MQLYLETNQLNLVANILMEHCGTPQQDPLDNGILDMVLARDLRFDAGQLERVADLLAAARRSLKEEIAREADVSRKNALQSRLALLDLTLERVNEACVMF
jgi:hypothetical protein